MVSCHGSEQQEDKRTKIHERQEAHFPGWELIGKFEVNDLWAQPYTDGLQQSKRSDV